MTRKESNRTTSEIKRMMAEDGDFLRPIVKAVIQSFWKLIWPKPSVQRRASESKAEADLPSRIRRMD